MKKHQLANKAISVLLAAAMCFSNVQPYTSMAYAEEVLEQQSDTEKVTEQVKETNPPETNPPETNPPETNPPETNPPETNPPETAAPETAAPETSAPATEPVTEAPSTEQTPATEVQPATETVPQTEAQSESESESESETEISMPAVVLTQTMEDGTVITVDAPEDAFPEGVQMRVTVVNPWDILAALLREKGYSAGDAQQLASELIASKDVRVRDYVAAYDISFYLPKEGNKEIKPEKKVEVTFSNVDVEVKKASQIGTFHIEDNGDATRVDTHNPSLNAAGNANATVKTKSFSIYVVDGDVDAMLEELEAADVTVPTSGNLEDFVADKWIKINDVTQEWGSSFNISNGDDVKLYFRFEEYWNGDDILQFDMADIDSSGHATPKPLTFDLPVSGFDYNLISTNPANGILHGTDDEGHYIETSVVFTLSENPNRLTISFPGDKDFDKIALSTSIWFEVTFHEKADGNSDYVDHGTAGKFYIDNTGEMTVAKKFLPASLVQNLTDAQKAAMTFSIPNLKIARRDANGELVRDPDTHHILYDEIANKTFSYADMTETLPDGTPYIKFDDVQPKYDEQGFTGAYAVSETNVPTIPGYDYTDILSQKTDSVVIEPFGLVETQFTNTYKQQVGEIDVKKDLDAPGLPSGQYSKIEFKLYRIKNKGTSTESRELVKTFYYNEIVAQSGTYKIPNLPVGDYALEETKYTLDGYDHVSTSYTIQVGSAAPSAPATLTDPVDDVNINGLQKDQTITVTYNNKYTRRTGSLEVAKTFDYPSDMSDTNKTSLHDNTKFTVKDGNLYVWFKATGTAGEYEYVGTAQNAPETGAIRELSYTQLPSGTPRKFKITGLPEGTYTVVETTKDVDGYARTSTYTAGSNSGAYPSAGVSAGVTLGNTTSVAFNNKYTESGTLKLKKTFANNYASWKEYKSDPLKHNTKFRIYALDDDDNVLGIVKVANSTTVNATHAYAGLAEVADGVYTIDYYFMGGDNPSKTLTITGIPFGKYKVEEISHGEVTGYTWTYEYGTEEATVGSGSSPTLSVTNTYTRKTGKLKVSKKFLDNNITDAQKGEVQFNITYSGKTGSVKYKDLVAAAAKTPPANTVVIKIDNKNYTATVTEENGTYTFEIEGLPTSLKDDDLYTVTESNYSVSGYIRETTVNGNKVDSEDTPSATCKVTEDTTPTVAFTNKYEPRGYIKIVKQFGPILDPEYYENEVKPYIQFRIWCVEDGKYVTHTVEGQDEPSDIFSYSDLTVGMGFEVEAGKHYWVEEIGNSANIEHYTRTSYVYSVEEGEVIPSHDDGHGNTIYDYDQCTGYNQVTGTDVKPSEADDVKKDKTTTWYFHNSYSIEGPGAGFWVGKSYTGLPSDDWNEEGTIIYKIHHRIKLQVKGYLTEECNDEDLIFDQVYSLTDAMAGKIVLAPGFWYTITELGQYNGGDSAAASDLYYDWEVTAIFNNQLVQLPYKFYVKNTDRITGFELTNIYTPYGALVYEKSIEGLPTEKINDLKNRTKFILERSSDGQNWMTVTGLTDLNGNPVSSEITLKDMEDLGGGKFRYEYTHLPLLKNTDDVYIPTLYRVREESLGVDGYTCVSTYKVTSVTAGETNSDFVNGTTTGNMTVTRGGVEADAEAGTSAAPKAEFKNVYTQDTGALIVRKNINDNNLLNNAQKNGITFRILKDGNAISWTVQDGKNVYTTGTGTSQFTYAEIVAAGGSFKVEGLPAASTYTVEEVSGSDEFEGFVHTQTVTITRGSQTLQGKTVVLQKDDEVTFTFNNTYKAKATLKVVKIFDPSDASGMFTGTNPVGDITFTIYEAVQQADGSYVKGDRAKDPNGNVIPEFHYTDLDPTTASKSFDVAPGTYMVVETGQNVGNEHYAYNHSEVNEVVFAKTDEVNGGTTVALGEEGFVTFLNKYDVTGSLIIRKTIKGLPNLTDAQKADITFIVRDAEGTVVKTFSVADMTLSGDWYSYTINDLPGGTYTVVEKINNYSEDPDVTTGNDFYGYICSETVTVNPGTVSEDGDPLDPDNPMKEVALPEVSASGATVSFTNNFTTASEVSVTKDGGGNCAWTTIDGVNYPYWTFTLNVNELSSNNFEIFDIYDVNSDYSQKDRALMFRLATAEDGLAPAIHLDESTGNKKELQITGTDEGNGQCKFVISNVDPEGEYINATITYYLIPKAAALGTLNSDLANDDGETTEMTEWTFHNVAKWKPLPGKDYSYTAIKDYYYKFKAVEKSIANFKEIADNMFTLVEEPETNPPTQTLLAHFVITFNPTASMIGEEDYLEAYDTISENLEVDWDRGFTFTPDLDIDVGPANDGVHTIHFQHIPNATTVQVEYYAKIQLSQGQNLEDISNNVDLEGFTATAGGTVDVTWAHDSGVALVSIDFIKTQKDHATNRLEGAEFTLYDAFTDSAIQTYESDEHGKVHIYKTTETTSLSIDYPYYVVETKEPTGYEEPTDTKFYFIIVKERSETVTINHTAYDVVDNTVTITNNKGEEIVVPVYLRQSSHVVENPPLTTKVKLGAMKTLVGKDLVEGQFSFTLAPVDGAIMPTDDPDPITVANDAYGQAVFGEITYDFTDLDKQTDGTYSKEFTYTVTEEEPTGDKKGISYDTTPKTVVVTVSYDATNKCLTAEVTGAASQKVKDAEGNETDTIVYFADVTNEYNAEGEKQFFAHKHMDGRKIEAEEFEFNLKLDNSNTITVKNETGNAYDVDITFPKIKYVLDDLDGATSPVIAKNTDGSYTVTIDPSNFNNKDAAGKRYVEYTYTVTETVKNAKGVTYATDTFNIKVVVTDNDDGTLTVKAFKGNTELTSDDLFKSNIVFNNSYKAKGEDQPEGTKFFKMDDQDLEIQEGQFEFNISCGSVSGIITNDADGKIQYPVIRAVVDPTITLEQGQTELISKEIKTVGDKEYVTAFVITVKNWEDFKAPYTVKVKEVDGGDPAINFDQTEHTLTVTIEKEDSETDGYQDLKVEVTDPDNFDFINTSEGGEGEARPEGKKYLNDDESTVEYNFTITYEPEDGSAPLVVTVKNDTTDNTVGKINYPAIKFEYKSDASETAEVTYDSTTNTIVISSKKLSELLKTDGYKFTVAEEIAATGSDDIVVRDTRTYNIVAIASKTGNAGELKVELKSDEKTLDFYNYGAEGEATPTGKKSLEGKDAKDLKAGEYKFKIYFAGQYQGQFSHEAGPEGTINYPVIKFKLDPNDRNRIVKETDPETGYLTSITIIRNTVSGILDDFSFTVEEVDPQDDQVIWDTSTLSFTATVSKDPKDQKHLNVELDDGEDLTFTNKITSSGGSGRTKGKKELLGRNLKGQEFKFELKKGSEVIGNFKNELNGEINYPTFTYILDPTKTPGTVKVPEDGNDLTEVIITVNKASDLAQVEYTVKEVPGTETGISYTTTEQKITVTPTYDPVNNKITVKAVPEANKPFINTYRAEGEGTFTGEKWLTYRLPEDDEFTYTITDKRTSETIVAVKNSGQTINYPTLKYVVDPKADLSSPVETEFKDGTIVVTANKVEDITGSYQYAIGEIKDTTKDYIVFDDTKYELKVNVKADPSDTIKLIVDVKQYVKDPETGVLTPLEEGENIDFHNEYSAEGTMELKAQKTLLGRLLNTEEFEYELKDASGKVLQKKKNAADGSIVFDPIKYTLADMDTDENGYVVDTKLTYTVKEVVPEGGKKNGVTYDDKEYKITVTLHDLGDGNINVKVEDEFGTVIEKIKAEYTFKNAFVNYYDAYGSDTVTGRKRLKGRNIVEDEFSFEIKDGDTVLATVKNADGNNTQYGDIQYPTFKYVVAPNAEAEDLGYVYDENKNIITYTVKTLEEMVNADNTSIAENGTRHVTYSPRTYTYTVTEVTGNEVGVTYNTSTPAAEYTLTATVDVEIDAETNLPTENLNVTIEPDTELDFVNTYRAKGSSENTVGNKELWGRKIADKEFIFQIKDSEGTVLGTVTNDADGKITYPIFTYIVDPDLTAGRTLLTADGTPDSDLTEVIVTYNEVESLPKGNVTYTVEEIKGDKDGNKESGVTYNREEFKDTINVTVAVAGEKLNDKYEKLTVEAKRASEAQEAVFKNYYKAKGEAPIEGKKWLTHRKPHDGEFTFQIKDSEGKVITDADGNPMSFTNTGNTINYPKFEYIVDSEVTAGTVYDKAANKITVTVNWVEDLANGFTYTIVEKDESADKPYINFKGALAPIDLKVTVTPTGEKLDETYDKLKVEIEKDKDNDFLNEYSAEGSLKLWAEKILEGRIMNHEEFAFKLYEVTDEGEKLLQTQKSTFEGKIEFETLTYDLDKMKHGEVVKTFDGTEISYVEDTDITYLIKEVVPAEATQIDEKTYVLNGVTYDLHEYKIVVTLHDDEEGHILVSVSEDGELFIEEKEDPEYTFQKAFVNCYDAEGENTVSGTKTLRGRKIKEGEYKFTISDDEGEVIATVSNKADGTINYPTFKYVVDHEATKDSVVFDEKSNTIIKTVDELEDMLTQVGKPGKDTKVTWDPKEYKYTVREIIPDDAVDANGTRYADRKEGDVGPYTLSGVTYNTADNKYDLTVTVSLNEKDQGILDVAIDPNEKLDFVNLYKAKGEATVSGKKILECADIANYEGAFEFTITDSDGKVIATVKNDIQGVIQYPTFRYIVDPDLTAGAVYDAETNVYTVTVNTYEDLKDVYTYNVDEVILEDETMGYNVYGDSYELKVTVKANEKDAANLDVTIPDSDDLSFTNRQYYYVGVAKIDAATKKDLKGAVLQLVASNGKVVEEWTTDGSTHLINLLEVEPGTYSFREKSAPKGYKLAETITFKVDKQGNVSSKTKFTVDKENNSIFTMKDERQTPVPPKTGDTSNVFEWMLAMILALAAAIVLLIVRRRRRAAR